MKNTVSEMKSSLDVLDSGSDTVEKAISEPKDPSGNYPCPSVGKGMNRLWNVST